jgi:hypothetical protein
MAFEIDLRFNRPLDDRTERFLNHSLDDHVLGLLRWRGGGEYVVLTFKVDQATREGALREVSRQAGMLWPNQLPDGVDDVLFVP